jgi:PAS domain S-box-containing protein
MIKTIQLSKDIILVSETNTKGEIIFANKDFCKIAGYNISELIGKPHSIVRHNDMPKEAFKDLWKTIQSGKLWNGIVKNKTKDGDYYWVNATAFPSVQVNGEIRYISTRVKPTDDEISKANILYSTLKQG